MLSMQTLLGWRTPEGDQVVASHASGSPLTTTPYGDHYLGLEGVGFLFVSFTARKGPVAGILPPTDPPVCTPLPDTMAELEAWARMVGAMYRSGQ